MEHTSFTYSNLKQMKKYTLGFIFNSSMDKVLLVHKLSPEWQRGKLNGLGGKLEPGEGGLDCIVREVREESGLSTEKDAWVRLGNLASDDWSVDVFALVYTGNSNDARSLEKEKVEWFAVQKLPANVIDNLPWLVAFAIDKLKSEKLETFSVRYK